MLKLNSQVQDECRAPFQCQTQQNFVYFRHNLMSCTLGGKKWKCENPNDLREKNDSIRR